MAKTPLKSKEPRQTSLWQQEPPDKLAWEKKLWANQISNVAGLDEAGRGAWAGPVVAAAVIFKPDTFLPEVDDSKKILPKKRERLFDVICEKALCFSVSAISVECIDEINILQASLMAMRQAVETLSHKPDYLLVDGNQGMGCAIPQELIINGDALSQSIGAASILAKVTRDRMMREMEKQYPQFGFSRHKGYGTKQHQEEISRFGVLPCHRKSFRPISNICFPHS